MQIKLSEDSRASQKGHHQTSQIARNTVIWREGVASSRLVGVQTCAIPVEITAEGSQKTSQYDYHMAQLTQYVPIGF